jgi:hypothetical protein
MREPVWACLIGGGKPSSVNNLTIHPAARGYHPTAFTLHSPLELSLSETEEPDHQPDEGSHQKKGNYDEANHVHVRTVARKSLGGLR